MMVSLEDAKAEGSSECIWMENGFFMGQRTDMTIAKANFPENTLVYVNQESISPVKNGYAIYPDFVILTQILPLANPTPEINLDTHEFKDNESLLFVPLYNTENGLYRGLTKKLARITLRDDKNETFYSYGFDKEKSKLLFCVNRQPIPNMFECTAFKKHTSYLLSENQEKSEFSKIFMHLPSTLDQKEDIQQYNDNVHLHPIDVSYEQLKVQNGNQDFDPSQLDDTSLRKTLLPIFYNIMKEAAGVSNHNLVRNSNVYMSKGGKIESTVEFSWIDDSYKEAQQQFQLGHSILDFKRRIDYFNVLSQETWIKILPYINDSHYLTTLLYVSKFFRKYIFKNYYEFYDLSTYLCAFAYWRKDLEENNFSFLHELYDEFYAGFDFEFWFVKLQESMRHLSLFSVCLHFLRCYRRCDKFPKSKYCFCCS